MPEVSYAVILTRDVARATAVMRAIAAQTPPAELLLVLNDPDEAIRAYATELAAGGARVLHDGVDLGIVMGWNLALREARAPYVCVIHEDCEPQRGCAARLLRTLGERPDAGAVCPLTTVPDGTAFAGHVFWRDGATTAIAEGAVPADVHAVDYATSSCLMVRRAAALAIGGFDERYFPAVYVDAGFGLALWRAGYVVLCDRRAVSIHHTGAMVARDRGPFRGVRFRAFLLARNRSRLATAEAGWLAGYAERGDAIDARNPQPSELADALARIREREQRVRATQPPAPTDRLALPADREAHAVRLRRELEEEFATHLIECEAHLRGELDDLHRLYGEQHAELDRVHRAYAELWADRERLREDHAATTP